MDPDLGQRIRALPSELIHIIRTFLPPYPPRPKPRDNGMSKQLEAVKRSPKLTAMALYNLDDEDDWQEIRKSK
jgi:hypothetical protein